MNPIVFQKFLDMVTETNPKTGEILLRPHPCERCGDPHRHPHIKCEAYRYGTPHQHFRHTCGNCKRVFFDGQRKRDPFLERSHREAAKGTRGPYKNRRETATHIITEY